MIRILFLTSILCLSSEFTKGQTSFIEFKVRYEAFIKGEMKIIGNHIVNRSEKRNKSHIAYDDRTSLAKVNDQFDMQYVDIDDSADTFSSSSADFSFENGQKANIVYAGLYWSGTYPYTLGIVKGKNYEAKNPNRETFHTVKVKIPNASDYVSVNGEIIFDGINDPTLNGISPYVCYAEITDLLKNSQAEGTYTVANVKAANGQIAGGVAAGWALVLVCESPTYGEKKLITYDGFSSMSNTSKTITFERFKTPSSGAFQTRIMGAVLEGDLVMAGDEVQVSIPTSEKSLTLENGLRRRKNFFNSSITDNGNAVITRKPASLNTLGFDIFHLNLPDENQQIIPNGATSLDLTFTRSADQYYLFLTALQIESIQEKSSDIRLSTMISNDIDSGYYVIVGVYSNEKNVKKQVEKLASFGYETQIFFDKKKNLHYIYTARFDDYKQAAQQTETIRANTDISDAWILNVKVLSE